MRGQSTNEVSEQGFKDDRVPEQGENVQEVNALIISKFRSEIYIVIFTFLGKSG